MPGPATKRFRSIACGCTPEEYAAIHARAHAYGTRAGTYVRLLALSQKLPQLADPVPPRTDQEAVTHLGAMRTLLNQIARHRNQGHALTKEQDLAIRSLAAQVQTLLSRLIVLPVAPSGGSAAS